MKRTMNSPARRLSPRGLIPSRLLESLAMVMIGDGLLAFLQPRRHVRLWRWGPAPWRHVMEPFEEHPELTRWLGAAELAAGLWLAFQQDDERGR